MNAQLEEAVKRAWAEERRFMQVLSPAQRAAEGTHEHWSAKDLVAHLVAAKERLVRAIDGELGTLEHAEPAVYEAHKRDSWPQVEAGARRAASELAARIERCTGFGADWLEGRSLESFIAGYAIRHPLGHLADFHAAKGDGTEAARVRAASESILAALPEEVAHPA